MIWIRAFWVGGLICVVGQILIDRTKMTSGRILVAYVVAGCILGGLGLYPRLVEYAGAGATVPLTGFGSNLAKGVMESVQENGFLGIFKGGLTAASGGLSAAVVFGFLAAVFFSPKQK